MILIRGLQVCLDIVSEFCMCAIGSLTGCTIIFREGKLSTEDLIYRFRWHLFYKTMRRGIGYADI